jgi:hypothetical protein
MMSMFGKNGTVDEGAVFVVGAECTETAEPPAPTAGLAARKGPVAEARTSHTRITRNGR